MTRNLKALGLALVAVFAMSAIAAQAAFAAEEFHAAKAPSIGTSEADPSAPTQTTRITKNGATVLTVNCKKFHGEGTQETLTATTTTLRPEYTECSSSIGTTATVLTRMCHYEISSKTDAEGHAHSNIVCPTGESITIESGGCTITVGSQTGTKGGVHFTTLATTPKTVTTKSTVTNIAYTSSGFGCELAGIPASGSESDYEGSTVTKTYEDKGGETTAYVEGAQIDGWYE